MTPYLVFDRSRLQALTTEYEASLAYTLTLLPKLNWNSPAQIKEYLQKHFAITIPNVQIKTLEYVRQHHEDGSEAYDVLTGALQYFKLKTTLNNYLRFILKNLDEHDRLYLKEVDGIWMIEKQRPIFHNNELWACVKSYSADLLPLIEALQTAQ